MAATDTHQKLSATLAANPGRTAKELAALAGIGNSTAAKLLAAMEAAGGAVRTAQDKGAATWTGGLSARDQEASEWLAARHAEAQPAAEVAATDAGAAADPAPAEDAPKVDGRKTGDRSHYLPRGGLKALVWAHMAATQATEWTPARLATAMGAKSSGAVMDSQNAAVRAGLAVQCAGSPRRYQWVAGAEVPAEQAALAVQLHGDQPL